MPLKRKLNPQMHLCLHGVTHFINTWIVLYFQFARAYKVLNCCFHLLQKRSTLVVKEGSHITSEQSFVTLEHIKTVEIKNCLTPYYFKQGVHFSKRVDEILKLFSDWGIPSSKISINYKLPAGQLSTYTQFLCVVFYLYIPYKHKHVQHIGKTNQLEKKCSSGEEKGNRSNTYIHCSCMKNSIRLLQFSGSLVANC